jgi:OmpA-OmpF porin, OOP family
LDIELEKATEGTTAVLQNIFFEVDRYDLQDKSLAELQKMLRFLKENPSQRVEISGHTDNSGSDPYNLQLSQRRAQAVYDHLVANGIDPKRLSPKGYGATRPLADNSSEEGRQKNRRIEFKLIR